MPTEKILVTGGYGFLGQYVIRRLKREYKHAIIFSPPHVLLDLMDSDETYFYFKSTRPDYVIHLAARVGGIGANQLHPGEFLYYNLQMGMNLMQAAECYKVKKFINVGTICMYPRITKTPFKEEDLWLGYPEETNAPYGLAKKMLMVMGQSYFKQYGFNCITLIPTNLYGPGDNFEPASSHVIPALIFKIARAIEDKAPSISVWGTGQASREFLYVDDCAEAIVKALKVYVDPLQPLNIGTNQDITIENLVGTLCDLMKFKGEIVWDLSKPDGQPARRVDVTKIQAILGWKARTNFYRGLKKTIDWFYKNVFKQGGRS